MKKYKEYIKFILIFIITYLLLSKILILSIGKKLIFLEEKIINLLFGKIINLNGFIFVPECSGILTISLFFGLIIAYHLSKKKSKPKISTKNQSSSSIYQNIKKKYNKKIIKNILILFILLKINLLRIIFIVLAKKISYKLAKIAHISLWFIFGIIIFILFLEYIKNEK
ncbi:MAG: hypothetical protein PHR26_03960 [Candidatus ainarchaeum sp.]|nr:hypothetical protein [Candidatus ainarchaeum sp.]MDD3976335.1 hypothetical protein [Candidatus ainarchaeum sp.]